MKRSFVLLFCFALALACGKTLFAQNANDAIAARAKKIHFSSLVLDTHIDVTPKLQSDWKFDNVIRPVTLICRE